MGTFVERLEILINANSAGAVKGLGKTTEAALGTEVATSKLGKALPYIAIGAAAVGAGVFHAVKAYDEAHRSVLQLENSLKNNTLLAGENKQRYLDLADALQQKTAADGDQIVSAEAILGTFRMTGDQIIALTPLVVDYARKFQVDLVSAAKQVGKAMDGQVSALRRNGVTIDETRFKTDRYGAVTEALRGQVGGFAEREGKTFSGRLETLKNNLGDLEEEIGGALAPTLTGLINIFIEGKKAADDFKDGFKDITDAIPDLGPIDPAMFLDAIPGAGAVRNVLELKGAVDDLSGAEKTQIQVLMDAGASRQQAEEFIKKHEASQKGLTAAERMDIAELEKQTGALKGVVDATFAKLNADLALQGSLLSVESAQNSYNESLAKNGADALETRQALNQYETAMVSAAAAAGKAAEQALGPDASGQEKARANTQAQIDTLTDLANRASPAAQVAIQAYIDKLKSTPEYWRTTIDADAGPAMRVIDGFSVYWNSKIAGLHTQIGLTADQNYPGHALGGVFTSPHMGLVAEAGPEAIIPLNKPNRAAQVMAEAGLLGGQSSGGNSYNINVTAGMGADGGQVGAAVVDAIKAYERRSGTAWRN